MFKQIVEIQGGFDRFLVGPLSQFPVRNAGRVDHPTIERIACQRAELAQLWVRLGQGFIPLGANDLAKWFRREVEAGRLGVVLIHRRTASSRSPDAEVPAAQAATHSTGVPGAAIVLSVQSLPPQSKTVEMLLRSLKYLPAESRAAFLSLISPSALKMLAAMLALWAVSHAVGIGEAIDIVLLGIGYALVGWQAFEAVATMSRGVGGALGATSSMELDAAAREFARGLTQLGINALLALLTHAGKGRAASAGEAEASVTARWRIYTDGLEMNFDASKGALWSKLGDAQGIRGTAALRAKAHAEFDNLATLESVLKNSDFNIRYKAEFGGNFRREIWAMVSAKFASRLKGTVTVYTDLEKLNAVGWEAILSDELWELGPAVTHVVFRDVSNPAKSLMVKLSQSAH